MLAYSPLGSAQLGNLFLTHLRRAGELNRAAFDFPVRDARIGHMDLPQTPSLCPQCHQPVPPEWYFCANCGKNLREKPPSTAWLMQIGLYLLSVFLPPLGLWPGMKYLRSSHAPARRVGIIVAVLTAISFVVSLMIFERWLSNAVQQASNTLSGFGGF